MPDLSPVTPTGAFAELGRLPETPSDHGQGHRDRDPPLHPEQAFALLARAALEQNRTLPAVP